MQTLILQKDHINQLINVVGCNKIMDNCINGLLDEYLHYDFTKTIMKKRDGFFYDKPYPGVFEWMPIMGSENLALIKLVSYNPLNPVTKNLPTIISQVNLVDTTTGHLVAIIDGGIATAIRTGAASAIASKFLAKKDSSILGLVGCGCQAVTQFHAISREFNLSKVYIYDIDKSAEFALNKYLTCFGIDIEIAGLEKLIEETDIICTATSVEANYNPVIKSKNVRPHAHINAVGSDLPNKIEISRDLLTSAYICPDYLDQAIVEGECQQLSLEEIGLDIISLLQSKEDFRVLREQVTVYDSTGIPLQDLVITKQFIDYAKQLKIGNLVELENISADPKNPYFAIDI